MLHPFSSSYLSISYYQSQTVSAGKVKSNEMISFITPNPHLEANKWGWAIDPIGREYLLKICMLDTDCQSFSLRTGLV
jgi:beta-glucosidase/6-phospho-beta-glucosidase/beta-galactosidase